VESEQHNSENDALEAAHGRRGLHIAVLYIEGPNGERIEAADFEARRKERDQSSKA
jgi:hypothetical protein